MTKHRRYKRTWLQDEPNRKCRKKKIFEKILYRRILIFAKKTASPDFSVRVASRERHRGCSETFRKTNRLFMTFSYVHKAQTITILLNQMKPISFRNSWIKSTRVPLGKRRTILKVAGGTITKTCVALGTPYSSVFSPIAQIG